MTSSGTVLGCNDLRLPIDAVLLPDRLILLLLGRAILVYGPGGEGSECGTGPEIAHAALLLLPDRSIRRAAELEIDKLLLAVGARDRGVGPARTSQCLAPSRMIDLTAGLRQGYVIRLRTVALLAVDAFCLGQSLD